MKLTVFTPTYNRAYIIENLYRSLQRQTCHDFEWLVVDDGSSDNTKALFDTWQKEENPFPIRYFYKENGGKHRAINYAVPLAAGELFFIVDSDDYLTDDAAEIILDQFAELRQDSRLKFAGVCNCRGYSLTEIMGTTFDGESIDCTMLEREQYGITGDKAEVFYTDVMQKYPFPEFHGEKFITECAVWDKMAEDGFYLRFFNQITYLCNYRQDGLTMQGMDLFYRNPFGYGYALRLARRNRKYRRELSDYLDAGCYWHWKKTMPTEKIAKLIGTSKSKLLWVSYKQQFRQIMSKIKSRIMKLMRVSNHGHS